MQVKDRSLRKPAYKESSLRAPASVATSPLRMLRRVPLSLAPVTRGLRISTKAHEDPRGPGLKPTAWPLSPSATSGSVSDPILVDGDTHFQCSTIWLGASCALSPLRVQVATTIEHVIGALGATDAGPGRLSSSVMPGLTNLLGGCRPAIETSDNRLSQSSATYRRRYSGVGSDRLILNLSFGDCQTRDCGIHGRL